MSNGIPDPWDVLANLTHITIYSPTITLIVKTGLDTIWPPQFILNSCQVQQDLELQMYCHLYRDSI